MSVEFASEEADTGRVAGRTLDLSETALALAQVAADALSQAPASPSNVETQSFIQAAEQVTSAVESLPGLTPSQRQTGAKVCDELAALIAGLTTSDG